ncbi:DUF2017 domain-containing protein [Kineococcus gynurae]|uniref:DUF2017 domain-containing protein n=1 Tax=Kineococcus gynurae TaxID=452979 RepID=A0ABV5LX47_9ACTN
MATFRRTRHGALALDLQSVEADVLASLAREVLELLDVRGDAAGTAGAQDPLAIELGLTGLGGGGPVEPPEDEVLARLLPDAYGDDPDASAEFRRFTESSLRQRKAAAATALLASLAPVLGQGGRVQLDLAGAQTWLAALNDIRLALGTRLGVSDDPDDEPDPFADGPDDGEDPEAYAWAVYDFTTHLQETLVQSLSRGRPSR